MSYAIAVLGIVIVIEGWLIVRLSNQVERSRRLEKLFRHLAMRGGSVAKGRAREENPWRVRSEISQRRDRSPLLTRLHAVQQVAAAEQVSEGEIQLRLSMARHAMAPRVGASA